VNAPTVLILTGPTCSGKTALALALAERFDAEIVGADSRQIYRGMPIGTAAPTAEQLARVRHHLVGFVDPRERYSAARFARDALSAIGEIHARGKRALVVGGTGFYLRALAGDVVLSSAYEPGVRARLAREAQLHPPEVLHAWLAARAPARAAALAAADAYRVVRALEIALAGEPRGEEADAGHPSLRAAHLPFVKLLVDVADGVLEERIAARIDAMLAAGLLAEAERVGRDAVACDAVGYPQALAYLAGWLTERELRVLLFRATRRYAKRQRAWFRREPAVRSIEAQALFDAARELPGWA
jgi:tRNA dimethylallyltransferase